MFKGEGRQSENSAEQPDKALEDTDVPLSQVGLISKA